MTARARRCGCGCGDAGLLLFLRFIVVVIIVVVLVVIIRPPAIVVVVVVVVVSVVVRVCNIILFVVWRNGGELVVSDAMPIHFARKWRGGEKDRAEHEVVLQQQIDGEREVYFRKEAGLLLVAALAVADASTES